MAPENESPAREPAAPTRGRGRGGRGRGRGRGGGRGAASTASVTKPAASRGGRGGTRRGRAKNFSDSRVQAAYERQRDLKATYQAVAHALKPALQELAERNVDELLRNPERYKEASEYFPVVSQLQENLDRKLSEHRARRDADLALAESLLSADRYVANAEFKNGVSELFEQFFEGQGNRLRILAALHAKQLPVDIRDDQYEFKVITDEHLDNDFGPYEAYKDGYLVPYPSRVEGTDMWQKARDADAATTAAAASSSGPSTSTSASASSRGRGRGRGSAKRRPQGEPEGQPTPKRSTRNTDDSQLLPSVPVAPAPAKGLLASAAEADLAPEGTPADEESPSATPEPGSFYANAQAKTPGKMSAREKSPPLPRNIADPDEYGVRIYNQRPYLRDKGVTSRLLAPQIVVFDDGDIGFRDSANDSSKGHTHAKRGKYLDTPNSNGMHFDHWCNGFDYSNTSPRDFDRALVQRHGVHPKYGIFLPGSSNEQEEPAPYVMPGRPVVFIANPSGRISHASRSFQKTVNHNLLIDGPWRRKIGASLRRFCKLDHVDPDDISLSEYLPTVGELKKRSLGTAVQELEMRPVLSELPEESAPKKEAMEAGDADEARPDLSVFVQAAAYVEAQDAAHDAAQDAARAAAASSMNRRATKYDAVRDLIMTESKPPPPPPAPASSQDAPNLDLLADLCSSASRDPPGWRSSVDRARTIGYPGGMSTSHGPEAQAPISNERDAGYVPGTPVQKYHGSIDMSSAYPAARHQHHRRDSTVEPSPYGLGRQPTRASSEATPYPTTMHDHAPPPPPASQPYKLPQMYGLPPQDQGGYLPHQTHGSYPPPDQRELHPTQGRGFDHGFEHRRMSSYAADAPSYSRPYWPQQPPAPQPAAAASHHYPLPPPASNRVPFSHNGSAEPLPPLRPPRGRHQSAPEDTLADPGLRQPGQGGGLGNPFYSSGSGRPYHHGSSLAFDDPGLGGKTGVRGMGSPQPHAQPYSTSPPRGFVQPSASSPTFGTMQMGGASSMERNSPETAQSQGMGPGSIFRHRSTPSGSGASPASAPGSAAADPNSKYRKLQPAPVPAHRAWNNRPELKTIPYDHKDSSGGAAALPNSGPTQIRGWNVNQHRRRNRSDKQDSRADAPVNEREDSR